MHISQLAIISLLFQLINLSMHLEVVSLLNKQQSTIIFNEEALLLAFGMSLRIVNDDIFNKQSHQLFHLFQNLYKADIFTTTRTHHSTSYLCMQTLSLNKVQQQLILIYQMQTQKQSYQNQRRRQISFSDLENNSVPNSRNYTPSKPSKEQFTSSYRCSASPLHNLHYKYLPDNYVSPEKKKQNRESAKQNSKQKDYSMKTEGMIKINSKIKNILESIEQEEKRKEVYVSKYSRDKSYRQDRYEPNQQKSVQKYQIVRRNDYTTPLRDKNMNNIIQNHSGRYSNMSSIKAQQKQNVSIHRDYNSKLKQSNISNDLQQKNHSSYHLMNSRYLNYSASRIKRMKQNEDILINGKNVDHQIDKIQMKIQELEKIKKNLGVDFQTTKVTQNHNEIPKQSIYKQSETKHESKLTQQSSIKSSIANTLTSSQAQKINKKDTLPAEPIEPIQQKAPKDEAGAAMIKSELFSLKENVNQEDVKVPKILRNLTSKRNKATAIKTRTEHSQLLQIQSTVSQFFNTNTQTPISLQTGRQHKGQLKVNEVNAAVYNLAKRQEINELKRLLSNLQKQIKADEHLRKAKKWFQRVRNQIKWCDLEQSLKKRGLSMSVPQMKEIFSTTSQEQNPFYTPREQDFNIADLVDAYQAAQQNWKTNIFQCYSRQKLQQAFFVQENIDISKRGCVSIQDLVRYMNYELDTFYRNRDVYLIYHRMKRSNTLRFVNLIQCITKKSP